MPNETVIENLVVSIGAKMDQFIDAMRKSKEATDKLAEMQKKATEAEKEGQKAVEGLTGKLKDLNDQLGRSGSATQDWATKSLVAFNTIKTGNELLTQKFTSTGEV